MLKKIFVSSLLLIITLYTYSQESSIDENRNKGYFNITKFGYIFVNQASLETFNPQDGTVLTDLPVGNSSVFSLQTINGYFISPHFSVGIGIGLDGYNNPNFNTMPLYLDLRGYFSDESSSIYTFLNYGTLIKIENGPQNGNTFNIGVGYKVPLNKNRFMIVTDISYSYKAVSNDGESIRNSVNYAILKGTMLSLGVIF